MNPELFKAVLRLLKFSLILIILGSAGLLYSGFTHDKPLAILSVIFYNVGCLVPVAAWLIVKSNWMEDTTMALIIKTNTYFEIPATTEPQNKAIKIIQDDKQNIIISQIAPAIAKAIANVTVSLSQLNDLIEALQKIKNQKITRTQPLE